MAATLLGALGLVTSMVIAFLGHRTSNKAIDNSRDLVAQASRDQRRAQIRDRRDEIYLELLEAFEYRAEQRGLEIGKIRFEDTQQRLERLHKIGVSSMETWHKLYARVTAYASDEVTVAMTTALKASQEAYGLAGQWQEATASGVQESIGLYRDLEVALKAANSADDGLILAIRTEIQN